LSVEGGSNGPDEKNRTHGAALHNAGRQRPTHGQVVAVSVLAEVLLALAALGLLSVASVAVITRMLLTRVRRSRVVNGAALRARARVTVGPQREVLKQRLRLAETLDSGQAAVDLAARSDSPHGELRRLFRRVVVEGAALQSQLQLLESERDAAVLAEAIPAATRRVDQVVGLVRQVRTAVAAGLGDRSDDNLSALYADADREITALAAGVRELHLLNGFDHGGHRPAGLHHTGYTTARPDPQSESTRALSMDRLSKGDRS
jgi:hypothetical protein